ncbi:uncharacterized protein CEXT_142101 [Caerostris extrusa]|uniref:Tudor domain-containing protein n=1 Tax=Caerostris extrusa TaxID=172846 RepID=A0AAV4UGT1_CAEEX|nr:uncharacterized protein CEXT_142101 [Caerostris extrusa]
MNESITLDELRDQMCLTYESPEHKFHPLVFEDLKVGMYLAARFEQDESWYRIQILRVNSESKQSCDVFVQYIDYGNKAFVKYCNLRPLLPQFVQYPIFSLKCSLAGVTPKKQIFGDNESKSEIWTEESVKKFQDLVNFERCLTAQICEPRFSRSVSGLPSLSPERIAKVKYCDAYACYTQLRNGLPQGAVLSCTLYNIMINDLVICIQRVDGIKVLLYADDDVVYCTDGNIQNANRLINEAARTLEVWCGEKFTGMNPGKTVCKLFIVSTKLHDVSLDFGCKTLRRI